MGIVQDQPSSVTAALHMNTAFLLMAQYDGKAIIPIDDVCRDYFFHLTPPSWYAKSLGGRLPFRSCG